MQSHRDHRTGRGVQDAVRPHGAEEPVAEEAAAVADADDLRVLGVGVLDFRVAFHDLPVELPVIEQRLFREAVHSADQAGQGVGDDEVGTVVLERLDRSPRAAAQSGPEQKLQVPVGDVGVLLGAGQGKLFFDDFLVEDEPGVVILLDVRGGAQQPEGAQGVVAGQSRGGEPAAQGVEPHRRRPGQDPDGVVRPDGVPVLDSLGVMPHAVAVDQPDAGLIRDAQHTAVNMFGDSGNHLPGRRAQALRPPLAHFFVVAADPAGGDDHSLGVQLEFADFVTVRGHAARGLIGCQDGSTHAGDGPAVEH